ncbi:hypothetical protein BGX38DRAFT_1215575 [Terfezia claveryi]|nr:hypothetical protein BGX38DRAFT_1215575 [Terfezia claveryi]
MLTLKLMLILIWQVCNLERARQTIIGTSQVYASSDMSKFRHVKFRLASLLRPAYELSNDERMKRAYLSKSSQ